LLLRVLQFVPLFFMILIVTYSMILVAPGDPVLYLVGSYGASEEYLNMMRQSLGLNRPWYEQLLGYMSRVIQGDLGYSLYFRQPVFSIIVQRLPVTMLLVTVAFVFSSIIGIILGVEAARRPFGLLDKMFTSFSVIGHSIPVFWTGMLLILVFAVMLRWFPPGGVVDIGRDLNGFEYVVSIFRHLPLPTIALASYLTPLIARITRTSMLETLRQDFITTARMKGLSERDVVYKHGLRNALLPVLTALSLQLGQLIAGATLTETVFSWPGLGRLTFDSITRRDWPLILGIFVFVSIGVMAISLITDLLYAYVDPRIEISRKS